MKRETVSIVSEYASCAVVAFGIGCGIFWGFDIAWRLAKGHTGLSWWIVFIAVWSFLGPFLTWAVTMALGTVVALITAAFGASNDGVGGPQP